MNTKLIYGPINLLLILICILAFYALFNACDRDNHSNHNHSEMESMANMEAKDSVSQVGISDSTHVNHTMHNQSHTLNSKNVLNAGQNDDDVYWNTLPANQTILSRQEVVKPVVVDTTFSIRTNGYITFDARRNHKVAARVGGRIERLFVKYNYQHVRKGDKILELYSPELNTDVDEYLYIRKNTSDSLLRSKAREKLVLLGLSAFQIDQIEKSGIIPNTVSVYSPYEGYVLLNGVDTYGAANNKQSNLSIMDEMANKEGSRSSIGLSSSDQSIREGMYINKNETLFWINDFKEVWGILAFGKNDEKYITKGQVAVVESELLPVKSLRSTIQFTEPLLQGGQKFMQARIYVSNEKKLLKQNSLIAGTVRISGKFKMLPATSIFYAGRKTLVWVRTGLTKEGSGIFQSRVLRIGAKIGNKVEVFEGLGENEVVAKDAAYMADSETIISY